jgi:uncharacterized protein (UPF0333 family)
MKFSSLLCSAAIIACGMSTVLVEHSAAKQSAAVATEAATQNIQAAQPSARKQAERLSLAAILKIVDGNYQGAMEDL